MRGGDAGKRKTGRERLKCYRGRFNRRGSTEQEAAETAASCSPHLDVRAAASFKPRHQKKKSDGTIAPRCLRQYFFFGLDK